MDRGGAKKIQVSVAEAKRESGRAIPGVRQNIFEVAHDNEALVEEQLAGSKTLIHVGRFLNELDINSIAANSPQSRGRVERIWKTFQNRLTSEL